MIKVVRRIDLEGKQGFAATVEEEVEFTSMEEAFTAIAQDASDGFKPANVSAIRRIEYTFDQSDQIIPTPQSR